MRIAGQIPDAHLRNTCRASQGPNTCRYITAGAEGFMCQAGTEIGAQIDARVAAGEFIAQAVHCTGLSVEREPPKVVEIEEYGRPLKSDDEFRAMRVRFQSTVLSLMTKVLLHLNPGQMPAFISLATCDVAAGYSRMLQEFFGAEDDAGKAAVRRHVAEAVKFTLDGEAEAVQSSFAVLCAHFGMPMAGPGGEAVAKRRKG